jgi:uncharacterized protein (TIGR03545 family)
MIKWFRWQGFVGFILVTVLLGAFFLIFIDGLIKHAIEKTGTLIVGAKVELEDADLRMAPFGVVLKGLQVTNPNRPMTNAVVVPRIVFSLNLLEKLQHKTIIEEMVVEEMKFNSDRKTSGAISKRTDVIPNAVKQKLLDKFQLPSLDIPDVKDILERETLSTLKKVEAIRGDIKTEKEKWERRVDGLPKKEKLEDYRNRIKEIQNSEKKGVEGILGGVSGVVQLKKDITADLDRLKEARGALKGDIETLKNQVKEARDAPSEDVRRLREKYSLSTEGLSNVSRLLFGALVAEWVDDYLGWYQRYKPYLERYAISKEGVTVTKPLRAAGRDVHYEEKNPLPSFLIRTADVSVEVPAGILSGEVTNITPNQNVLGAPLRFRLAGEKLKDLESVKIEGEMNRLKPSKPRDVVKLDMKGVKVKKIALSKNDRFPVDLRHGRADLEGNFILSEGKLEAHLLTRLQDAALDVKLDENAKWLAKAMASTLSDVKRFTIQATISGSPEDYDVKLSSDLDGVLKDAVGKQVRDQAAQFEEKLRNAVSEKVKDPLAELDSSLGGLNGFAEELTSRLTMGDELLKELAQSGTKGLKLPF